MTRVLTNRKHELNFVSSVKQVRESQKENVNRNYEKKRMFIDYINSLCSNKWAFVRRLNLFDFNEVKITVGTSEVEFIDPKYIPKVKLDIAKVAHIEKPKDGINIDGIGSKTAQLLGV